MSRIINEAKVKNPLIVGIREQLEHRALWMYLLCDEAEKHGLKAEDGERDQRYQCTDCIRERISWRKARRASRLKD